MSPAPDSAFVFESVPCAVCAADDAAVVVSRQFFGTLFQFVRCRRCGLVYQNPRLTRESMASFYDSPAYTRDATAGYDDYAAGRDYQEATARRRLAAMAALQPGAQRTLEFGSGGGSFVYESRAAGHPTEGVELSTGFAALAEQRYGMQLLIGDFATADVPAGPYDRVCAWGAVGNVHEPKRVFQRVAELLRPGGMFFCNFFDIDHWTARLRGARYFRYVPSATYNYSRTTLPRLLEQVGLHVQVMRPEWQVSSLGKAVGFLRIPVLSRGVQRLGASHTTLLVPTLNGYFLAARRPAS